MTDISTIKEIVSDGEWMLMREEKLLERSLAPSLLERSDYEVVEVSTGVRRSGKSKLLMWVGRKLMENGRKVYYLNFEDERFMPDEDDFRKLSSVMDLEGAVLLVDEPQNMPKWELWVRRMHDRGVKVYVTGSNSRLLGKEISTSLGGRNRKHEVFPFSFEEYLRAKHPEPMPSDQKTRLLEEYMVNGGYPYPTMSGDYSILSEYRSDIMERDILWRHAIRDEASLRNLIRFLMSNPGLYVSHRAVKGFIDISHVTLRKYLNYIEDAYAVIALEKFSYSQKEQINSPRKFYPVDNGLLMKKSDEGRLLESVIVQHLRRCKKRLYYWKDERGREIDVYLPDEKLAIQVVYELNSDSRKREERALLSASEKLNAIPLIVYLHLDEETEFPKIKATDFLEILRDCSSLKPPL